MEIANWIHKTMSKLLDVGRCFTCTVVGGKEEMPNEVASADSISASYDDAGPTLAWS